MPNTLIPIQTYTLTASTTTVTFSNIPQNYTDLKLVVSARQDNSDNNLLFRPNGATTSLSSRMVTGDGSAISSNTSTTPYGLVGQTGLTASTFGSAEWTIPNYTSAANYKSWSVDECNETNATTAYTRISAGLWSNTAAITSITLVAGSSGNFISGSTFTLYGISNGVKATGGTITVAGGYAYHTFTSTANFLPSVKITNAETLLVAGGGSGGYTISGGGGAGGYKYISRQTLNAGNTYTAIVGAGGAAATVANGTDSMFLSTSATGGGYGGSYGGNGPATGGSGGGGQTTGTTGAVGISGQGNTGGNGVSGGSFYASGGGGGAGSAGSNGNTNVGGGAGGAGISTYTDWHAITGTGVLSSGLYYIAGGGGGGGYRDSGGGLPTTSAGGAGGGGAGSAVSQSGSSGSSGAGTANTGGGGGGAGGFSSYGTRTGGNGGSGVIIVRYPIP